MRRAARKAAMLLRVALGGLALLLPQSAPPVLAEEGRYALLTFLHTNDLHGRVLSGRAFEDDSRGGLARAATLVGQLKAELPNVIFVDSGDLLHGSPVEFMNRGRSMVEAMNAAGIEIACPGNHEFDWGQDAAQKALNRADFPWVTANVVERETGLPFPPVQPYVLREAGGVRVAFFGLTTLQTVDLEWPPFISRIRFLDPVETARKLVPELRQKADLVVLLSHLGATEDGLLAAQVPGIDVILGAHSHTAIEQRLEIGGTLIAQTGYHGQNLGRLDLIMKRGDNDTWRIESVNGRGGRWWNDNAIRPLNLSYPTSPLIPLTEDIPPHPEVVEAYRPYWEKWQEIQDDPLGESEAEISDEGKIGDTLLSRFLADRLREATAADISLVDGKWKGTIPKGTVPVSAVWNSMGGYTGQNILRFTVTGSEIRRFLEQYAGSPEGLTVGVSGLTARLDSSRPEGQRVIETSIGGKPLDDTARYTVSGVMFVVRRFPSLIDNAPKQIEGEVEWSRPLILEAARKAGRFRPELSPRLLWNE